MNNPKISVIMGIYNCEKTLDEAINSILNQTYEKWQVIMCDDASSDKTYEVANKYVKQYPDKFILIKNDKNMGLNYTLNHCLSYADGDYIARMDGDDISTPDRFEKEAGFLNSYPEYSIVSCPMIYFDENGEWGKGNQSGEAKAENIAKGTPFCHAPCMVRKIAYDAVEGYTVDKRLLRMEDYELWIKMYAKGFKGYNLNETLYKMRDDRAAAKRRAYKYRINEAYVRYLAIKRLNLSKKNYIYVLRPLILGLLPSPLYKILHKKRLKG